MYVKLADAKHYSYRGSEGVSSIQRAPSPYDLTVGETSLKRVSPGRARHIVKAMSKSLLND